MIRVAGYCRVSTDREDQANSFASQQRYFREYIRNHPGWELHEIYADEGITGTSTKKRVQFNRMIRDAYAGKFRLILTKEVSRFSRNILDTIAYTRQLRAMGIGVIFAADGINTLEPEAEMLLSFLASMAQEESRRTSARVVWGQTRQMERGVVFGPPLLGYTVKNGVISIEPEGAEAVRLIFHKYGREQVGTAALARYLTQKGIRTGSGSTKWYPATLVKILRNEKYVGDLVQKKTYTPDFLTHEKRPNRGAVPQIILKNHHEPIVDRELWELAQARLAAGNKHGSRGEGHSNRYIFSGKIRCGQCGSSFVGRVRRRSDGSSYRRWSCAAAVREGRAGCSIGRLVRDDNAIRMLQTAIAHLPLDADALARETAALATEAIMEQAQIAREDPNRLRRELERVQRKREAVLDSYFSGEITSADMQTMLRRFDDRLARLNERLAAPAEIPPDREELERALQATLREMLRGSLPCEPLHRALPDSLTIYADRHSELRLKHLPFIYQFDD